MINVVIADDHPLVSEGIHKILARSPDMKVVGNVAHGADVANEIAKPGVDVLLLDIEMPGPGFIALLRDIKEFRPQVRVLILSAHPEEHYAIRALRAGAAGYLTKTYFPEEIVKAIRWVAAGRKYISKSLAERLVFAVEPDADRPQPLSEREYEVLGLLATGKSLKEIAALLGVNPKTVSTYRARMLDKLDLKTNADLIRYALDHGLVS